MLASPGHVRRRYIHGCSLGAGLKDGVPLEGEGAELLVKIAAAAFPEYDDAEAQVKQSLENRPSRANAYAA